MTIAFDFDGTYAADPVTWRKVAEVLEAAGHTCILVTARPGEKSLWSDEVRRIVGGVMPIIFTGRIPKAEAVKQRGFDVDIWIDDAPEFVHRERVFVG